MGSTDSDRAVDEGVAPSPADEGGALAPDGEHKHREKKHKKVRRAAVKPSPGQAVGRHRRRRHCTHAASPLLLPVQEKKHKHKEHKHKRHKHHDRSRSPSADAGAAEAGPDAAAAPAAADAAAAQQGQGGEQQPAEAGAAKPAAAAVDAVAAGGADDAEEGELPDRLEEREEPRRWVC